jgi:hypothetical protein
MTMLNQFIRPSRLFVAPIIIVIACFVAAWAILLPRMGKKKNRDHREPDHLTIE